MDSEKNPEEIVLEELRRSYVKEGVLQPKTPQDKFMSEVNSSDQLLREHHLELESEIQKSLQQVTTKMSAAQTAQNMTFLVKEINELLSGGDASLAQNKARIAEIVQKLDEEIDLQRETTYGEVAKCLNKSVTSLAEANAALLQARSLDSVYTSVKAMAQVLLDFGANDKVH